MLGEAPDAGRFGERKRALSACPDGILELVPDVVASQHARWRCPAGKHICVVAGFHEQSQRERLREEGGERRKEEGIFQTVQSAYLPFQPFAFSSVDNHVGSDG